MANEKAEKAKVLYAEGVAPAEIARQLGVPLATISSWKRRHGWQCNTDATQCNVAVVPEKEKRPRGRPASGKYDIPGMVATIGQYIDEHKDDLPILKECCLLNSWDYDYVMKLQRENEDLRQAIKKLLDWKEVRLERGGLAGDYDKTMVIFTLKQPAHGWSDKPVARDGIDLEDLTPLAELLKDDENTDDTLEAVQPEAQEVHQGGAE